MGRIILLALIVVPLIEIAAFVQIGGLIGLWPTLALVVLTAIAGAVLLRQQGLSTLGRAQTALQAQRFPARELFDTVCLLVAGALLLTPGFFTDLVGFALLVPFMRYALGTWMWNMVQRHGIRAAGAATQDRRGSPGPGATRIIDGEYVEIKRRGPEDDGTEKPQRPS